MTARRNCRLLYQLDELNNLAVAEYTSAGAITPGGKAFLKTGTAGAMTLALPLAGPQLLGGNDGMTMKIIALDAHAYVVTTPADGINGADDTATFAGRSAMPSPLESFRWNWVATGLNGVTLSEV